MDLGQALVLGVVEGITEFLPVSSTGHLILTTKLLGMSPTEFLKSFEIIIQLGAILAVVALYWRKLILDRETLKRVTAAFFPTATAGLILYKFIKKFLLGNSHLVLWTLLLGGIFLIAFELLYKERKDSTGAPEAVSYSQAVVIGLCQSLAMIPGVSRSAATIVGGLMMGLKRKTIVEFSFLLAVPTMAAATLLDLLKNAETFSFDQIQFLSVGFVMSFVVAILSIKFLLYFIKNNNFIVFAIYRIVLALLAWRLVTP